MVAVVLSFQGEILSNNRIFCVLKNVARNAMHDDASVVLCVHWLKERISEFFAERQVPFGPSKPIHD